MTQENLWEVMSRQPGWEWHALVHSEDWGDCIDEVWAYQPGATPEHPEGNPWLVACCLYCREMVTECECRRDASVVEVEIFIDPGGPVAGERVMRVALYDLEFFLPFAVEIPLQAEHE